MVQKVQETDETYKRRTIYDKTYSTYALDIKWRHVYTSLRIGVGGKHPKRIEGKSLKVHFLVLIKWP